MIAIQSKGANSSFIFLSFILNSISHSEQITLYWFSKYFKSAYMKASYIFDCLFWHENELHFWLSVLTWKRATFLTVCFDMKTSYIFDCLFWHENKLHFWLSVLTWKQATFLTVFHRLSYNPIPSHMCVVWEQDSSVSAISMTSGYYLPLL